MNIETLNNNAESVMRCGTQDSTGLNDFQKLPNQHGTAIPKVGIERFRVPLSFIHENGEHMTHDGVASMFCYLAGSKTGVNMSRFVGILQEEVSGKVIDKNFFKDILNRYRMELRDYDHEDPIKQTSIKLRFNYPLKQKSLKSENWGWQYYQVELEGTCDQFGNILMHLTTHFEYSSTCPCSLSMAKQYEKDFRDGNTDEGSGIASAHSQRSLCICKITYNLENNISIEELINLLRIALPTETQPMVKRLDEQAFAILNADNPMFVEHASRRLSHVLNLEEKILDWEASVEHFESLHSHNAVAYIRKQ
ncbi:MAG: GTP cyclohydrolase I FolE2 [Bacteriovoracaceae bacterium]|jgi:GTP cyclohydrolase IB|nr:GTP cyclohydrolase I FolE2 [Bacteriovoracaceae bacterium]